MADETRHGRADPLVEVDPELLEEQTRGELAHTRGDALTAKTTRSTLVSGVPS